MCLFLKMFFVSVITVCTTIGISFIIFFCVGLAMGIDLIPIVESTEQKGLFPLIWILDTAALFGLVSIKTDKDGKCVRT